MRLPELGQEFAGKFEILSVLGEGGMGVVYRACQRRLEREVAIKVVRPELLAAGYEAHRFEREARAVAQLQGPHVVRVFDIDTSPEGLPFLVMELLKGRTLASELELRGSLPVAEAVRTALECCEALSLATAAGIVHRDVKPSNIFLAGEGRGQPMAKLLDFGIIKMASEAAADSTRSGIRMGTPRYMSPEQLRSTASVDHRSDLWSLGVTLFEALSGRTPFNAENDADLTIQIVIEEPERLTRLVPDVPAELERVVERLLRKDRALRYQHADELGADLRAFLARAADEPSADARAPTTAFAPAAPPAAAPMTPAENDAEALPPRLDVRPAPPTRPSRTRSARESAVDGAAPRSSRASIWWVAGTALAVAALALIWRAPPAQNSSTARLGPRSAQAALSTITSKPAAPWEVAEPAAITSDATSVASPPARPADAVAPSARSAASSRPRLAAPVTTARVVAAEHEFARENPYSE